MKLFLLPALLAVLPSIVSATYFTSPQAGTVWDSPQGKTITWFFQPGGAAVGTIILESVATNPKSNTQTVLADSLDLMQESLDWPSGLLLSAVSTTSFRLLIVNTEDHDTVYSQVGPFTIESLTGAGAGSSSSAATTTTSATSSTRAAGSSTTNPPISTAPETTTRADPSTTSTTETTTSTTTTPSTSSTTTTSTSSSSTFSSSSSSSSSSSTTSSPPPSSTSPTASPSIATVLSTASLVTLTSTSSSDNNVVTVLSTAMASAPSPNSASGSVGAASAGTNPTSGAAKRMGAGEMLLPKGWSAVGTVLLGVACGMVVLG